MSQGTLPVLSHPDLPQVLTKALDNAFGLSDDQRKEANAAMLNSLWNLGESLVMRCELCGMADGQPGKVHVFSAEKLCLPCARELYE